MERLKGRAQRSGTAVGGDLHSSMERLKAAGAGGPASRESAFTFQYGEIKRFSGGSYVSTSLSFTFQYGEIKSRSAWERLAAHAIYIPVWRD